MSDPRLHRTIVRAPAAEPAHAWLFLHGILGTGANLRGLAQAFVQADASSAAVLVDLRLHGRSQGFAPPHDVGACARDLVALEAELDWPVRGVIGHSFGGKVALAYHALRPALARLALLDSDPGARPDRAGSEQTDAVLALLAQLPARFERREDFIAQVHVAGHSRAIADWLAMNLERKPDGFALRLDLTGIRALLDSYFALDLWPVLERSSARVDVVIGGRSRLWDAPRLQRLEVLARDQAGKLRVHILADAGHWVHVDDPQGLRRALLEPYTPR